MSYQGRLWNRYKSDGERKIGNYLKERKIPFTYEKPVALLDGDKTKIWHPDFYLDTYHILIEYFGMDGNRESAKINAYKRKAYKENSLELIELTPSDFKNNWQKKIDMEIKDRLEHRLEDYFSKYASNSYESQKAARQLDFGFYSGSQQY